MSGEHLQTLSTDQSHQKRQQRYRGKNRRTRPRIRIGMVLIGGFGGLMGVAVAGTLWLGLISAHENTFTLFSEQAELTVDVLVSAVDEEMRRVEQQAAWISDAFATGRLNGNDPAAMDRFLMGTLAATPRVAGFVVVDPELRGRVYYRHPPRVENVDYGIDSAIREAVELVQEDGKPAWRDPVWREEAGATLLNLHTPLYREGRYLGLLIQGMTLSDLSDRLSRPLAEGGLTPFVLYDGIRVVAHPLLVGLVVGSATDPAPSLEDFGDPVLAAFWDPNATPMRIAEDRPGFEGHLTTVGGREFGYIYKSVQRPGAKPLVIGAYFGADVGNEQLGRLQRTAWFGLAILVISIVAAVFIARHASVPIQRLAMTARLIRADQLEGFRPLPRSGLKEIDDASFSFNAMVGRCGNGT